MAGVPEGGILGVHIPRPRAKPLQDIADAMSAMGPELKATSVEAVEFYLPGLGKEMRRQVIKYVRQPDGTFAIKPVGPAG
jgi:hypothetical protein